MTRPGGIGSPGDARPRALYDRPFVRVPIPKRGERPLKEWVDEIEAMGRPPREATERHLEMAFLQYSHQMQAELGERINQPGFRALYDRLMAERHDHPAVSAIARLIALQEALEEREMVRFSLFMGKEDDPNPPAWRKFGDLKRAMDEGIQAGEEPPSHVFETNRLLIDNAWVQSPVKSQRQCREARKDYERAVQRCARERYRNGFYADPFTPEPRPRNA